MDFTTLPRWATPIPGESRASWLAATGQLQPMAYREWVKWVRAALNEPERPQRGTEWLGLPECLGDVRLVPPTWRLHPSERNVFCPQCQRSGDGGAGWITRIHWLDARQLVCNVHAAPLVSWSPGRGIDSGHAHCMDRPEVHALVEWLGDWCRHDVIAGSGWHMESLWRRDLVRMAVRNWNASEDHPAGVVATWDLQLWGWEYQHRSPSWPAGQPPRLGMLPAAERLGALLVAHRCWNALLGSQEIETRLRLPAAAWGWFLRRWLRRVAATEQARLITIAKQCTDLRRARRRSRPSHWWR